MSDVGWQLIPFGKTSYQQSVMSYLVCICSTSDILCDADI
jgi:hypothetical protein